MHILQLLPALDVGGVERGVLDLAKGLIARGHQVTVISSGGRLVESLTVLGARHHTLPVHQKSLRTMVACVPEVTRLIAEGCVDIVHARSRVPAWIGYAAARRAQRPFVTTAHGFYRPHLLSRVMGYGRQVIVPSQALADYLVETFRVPRARLRVIPRGVDLETFPFRPPAGPHHGPWRIGVVGRLTAIKGHDVALQAAALLRQRRHDVQLVILGAGPAPVEERVKAQAAALGLSEAVEWLGLREDVAGALAGLDLVVVPSVYPESFGRAVVEAQATGRPVVASRIGALPELIEDGQHGLLVRPGDPRELAEALQRLITDEALRRRCIEEGRRRVEREWPLERMVDGTIAVYQECLEQPRILIWKLSALGDVLLSTPSLRAVRRQFPKAHITLIVGRAAAELVARCPYLDELIVYDPRRKDRGVRGHWALLKKLRAGAFDLSIDLQNSRRTHLLAWLAGIPVRIGYARKWGRLLNRGIRLPRVVLAPIAHQQYLLRQAGLTVDGDALEIWPSAQEDARAQALVGSRADGAPVVGVHPGGSGRWKTKRWDLDRWAQLCEALAQRQVRVIVTGGPEERGLWEALTGAMRARPVNAIGQTSLLELACLIKRCDVFIAHDSSTLHLAAAVGTPTVALFGPTDPARHLPPRFAGQVIKKDVFCSPCYSTTCRTITHACMKRIAVDDVLTAVLGQLAERELSNIAAARRA